MMKKNATTGKFLIMVYKKANLKIFTAALAVITLGLQVVVPSAPSPLSYQVILAQHPPKIDTGMDMDRPVSSPDAPDQVELKRQQLHRGGGSQPANPGAGMTDEIHHLTRDLILDQDGSAQVDSWIQGDVHQKIEWYRQDGKFYVGARNNGISAQEISQKVEIDSSSNHTSIQVHQHGQQYSLNIKINGESLVIEQSGPDDQSVYSVQTELPVSFDKENGTLSITTASGTVVVHHLPSAVFEAIKAKKILSTIEQAKLIEDASTKQAVYQVEGQRQTRLLYLIPIDAEIIATLNTTTGDVLDVQQPWYLQYLGFLFS